MDEVEIKKYVDTVKALERIRGNAKLFKMLLTHFLDTRGQVDQLKQEISANDRQAAAKSVHAIKGVAANLSMTALYELCPPFEVLLKTDEDAAELMAAFQETYEKTLTCVNHLLANPPA
ncbi:MAG: Hpt domain-containing protein [Synergistaceae bacterium]|jgi:HPt (histidine-containing phosphotransfer) domain-containing protein|nr:Hpt domain-containing protein [Synergistaceae bacterium]